MQLVGVDAVQTLCLKTMFVIDTDRQLALNVTRAKLLNIVPEVSQTVGLPVASPTLLHRLRLSALEVSLCSNTAL